MAKYEERIKARSMRLEGFSILAIARELKITKGTVSKWCRDVALSEEQSLKLEKNKEFAVKRGQRMGAEINKNKRLKAILDAEEWGKKIISSISDRDLLLLSMALYWCEGSKSDRTSGFVFVNSDPDMVYTMKYFLTKYLSIPEEDIVCSIQINRVHEMRIGKVLNFWKNLLELPEAQFRKPYYVNTKVSKVYENYDNYYGVCRLLVRRGMNLKYKMLGLIKAVKVNILPA